MLLGLCNHKQKQKFTFTPGSYAKLTANICLLRWDPKEKINKYRYILFNMTAQCTDHSFLFFTLLFCLLLKVYNVSSDKFMFEWRRKYIKGKAKLDSLIKVCRNVPSVGMLCSIKKNLSLTSNFLVVGIQYVQHCSYM